MFFFFRIKKKEKFISFKSQNIGENLGFLKFLVFRNNWQVNNRQVFIVAQYIICVCS